MKNLMKILILSVILFSITEVSAQGKGVNYQATLRDTDGNLMMNEDVTVIFDIRVGTGVGPSLFNETHNVTTNEYGGFSVVINKGILNSGNYYSIDWSAENHFLNVNVNGNDLGTSWLQEVPYAQHANTASSLTNPVWERDGTNTVFTLDEVIIGTNSNNGELLYVNAPDVDLTDELVDFSVENLTTNRDVLNIEVGNASSDFGQFIECRKGTDLRFKVDVNGSVLANEVNATPTGTANLLPIAYGHVAGSGTIFTNGGTGNFSVTKNGTGLYVITITGETLNFSGYSVFISPETSFSGAIIGNHAFPSSGVDAGKLYIYTYSISGSLIDNPFSFSIYKP